MSELFSAAGKRCRVLVMSGRALFGFMRGLDGRSAFRLYGMPADTKCLGVSMLPERPGDVAFLLESKEWAPLESGAQEIPQVEFEILQAIMPQGMRLEKPKAMLQKLSGGKALPS